MTKCRFAPVVPILIMMACSSSSSSSTNDGPTPGPDRADAGPNPNDASPPPPYPPDASTSVVVGVDVEDFRPTLGMGLERVHVLAKVDGQVAADEMVDLRSGNALPHETKLVAPKGKTDAAIDVTVEGYVPQTVPGTTPDPNVVRLVTTRFVPNQTKILPLRLEARCASKGPDAVGGAVFLGPTCTAPQTCVAAACVTDAVDAAALAAYTPTWEKDMPDACRASPPSIAVGTGETDFSALKDGDTVQIIEGPQCGHHIWIDVKTGGLRQYDAITTITSAQPGTSDVGPSSDFAFSYGDAGGGLCVLTGTRYQVDAVNGGTWKDFLGKPLDVTVKVADSDGKSQATTIHLNVDANYQKGPRNCGP
jgi:hypothetical protein